MRVDARLHFLAVFIYASGELVLSDQSFLMQLNEEVNVVKQVPAVSCFNKSIVNNVNRNGTEKFVFSRGVLLSINYETINPLGDGTTRISMRAEFQCCAIYCEKFGRLLNKGTWISGNINMDIVDESTVGIYYKEVQVCHTSYLKGIFGQSVLFSPFTLEGSENECLTKKDSKPTLTYTGIGNALRISAANVGTNSITMYFGFLISNWSRNFLLKLMREGEHGTLTNVKAVVYIKEVKTTDIPFGTAGVYFSAVALFGFLVAFLAAILLICTRSRRVFLEQTWKTYDAYIDLKMKEIGHTNDVALQEVSIK